MGRQKEAEQYRCARVAKRQGVAKSRWRVQKGAAWREVAVCVRAVCEEEEICQEERRCACARAEAKMQCSACETQAVRVP